MRYFDRNRRRLTKKHFVRGTLTKSNGENEVTIENSAGLPLNGICISGNTQQYVDADNPLSPDHPQAIENLNVPRNMFDESTVVVGKHISDTGVEANNTHQRLSDYIEIEPNTTYRLSDVYNTFTSYGSSSQTQYDRCACYDESKTLISVLFSIACAQKGQHTNVFTTPENAKYVKITQGKFAEKTMLTKSEAFVPYVPFGCGSHIVMKGTNLISDVYDIFWHTSTYTNALKKVEKDGRNCIYYIFNTGRQYVIEGGFKENTQYTFSFDYKTGKDLYGSATSTQIITVFYTNGTRATFSSGAKEWSHKTFTTAADRTIAYIGTYTMTNVEIWIDRDTFMLQEGAISDPVYEPYFREEIAIPASVEVDESTLPLLMSEYDSLIVNTRENKVTYIEGSWQQAFTGTEFWSRYGSSDSLGEAYIYNPYVNYGIEQTGNEGYCSHFVRTDKPTPATNSFCVNQTSKAILFCTDKITPLADFETWLQEKYAECDPVVLLIKRLTPIEHDITETDFGQALLNLVVPRTQNGVLRVESALPASGLEVEYYSMEKEDKVTLEVLCVSEVGEELKRTSHSVRKDSKYQVKAPLIDGYTPINESIFGVASEEAEIIFEYKENEDATV